MTGAKGDSRAKSDHGQRSPAGREGDELARLKRSVIEVVWDMDRSGLTEGTAGNVSARTSDGEVILTPAAMHYPEMTESDLVVCDLDGNRRSGSRPPTSEIELHLSCLRQHADIRAVVHTHAVHASMFAVAQQPIPCVLEEFEYYVGGDVLVAPYHRTGSAELGSSVAALLGDRAAALIANHGLVVVGTTPAEALQLTKLVERAARIVWGARAIGDPVELPEPVRREFSAAYLERRRRATEA